MNMSDMLLIVGGGLVCFAVGLLAGWAVWGGWAARGKAGGEEMKGLLHAYALMRDQDDLGSSTVRSRLAVEIEYRIFPKSVSSVSR